MSTGGFIRGGRMNPVVGIVVAIGEGESNKENFKAM